MLTLKGAIVTIDAMGCQKEIARKIKDKDAVDLGQPLRREEPFVQWKAAAFARWHEPDESRGSSPDL